MNLVGDDQLFKIDVLVAQRLHKHNRLPEVDVSIIVATDDENRRFAHVPQCQNMFLRLPPISAPFSFAL